MKALFTEQLVSLFPAPLRFLNTMAGSWVLGIVLAAITWRVFGSQSP